MAAYHSVDEETRLQRRARVQAWQAANRATVRASFRKWYYRNRDYCIRRVREWQESHSDKVSDYQRVRSSVRQPRQFREWEEVADTRTPLDQVLRDEEIKEVYDWMTTHLTVQERAAIIAFADCDFKADQAAKHARMNPALLASLVSRVHDKAAGSSVHSSHS